jgi:unsaturated chondroitin disaccharide hydrolase
MSEPLPTPDPALRQQMLRALDFAASQARRIVTAYPGYYPMYTVGGRWNREGERWTHWCEGFFPGVLWLLHKHTGDAEWRRLAEQYTRPLEPRKHDRAVHDLGFLFFSTYLRWYHLTDDPALRGVLIEAGRTLALRRQKGGYLASFVGPQSLFIDIMMNVGIVFWAANATGDAALRQVALEHCRTTARYLVRPGGGTAHEGIFDVETGQFLRQSTHQGYRADSTWSRGLAWAVYGFTAAHRLSGEAEFLDTARRCADHYLRRTRDGDEVPPWDFDVPARPRAWDSSAAAITASGLWDLAEQVPEAAGRDRYKAAALRTLARLCDETFLPVSRPEWEGILMHGVYHIHKGLGVDESVAWGDHFFVEALVKATAGRSEAAW